MKRILAVFITLAAIALVIVGCTSLGSSGAQAAADITPQSQVHILTPPDNADKLSGDVHITTDVTDDYRGFTFLTVDGVKQMPPVQTPSTFTWDSTKVNDGSHQLGLLLVDPKDGSTIVAQNDKLTNVTTANGKAKPADDDTDLSSGSSNSPPRARLNYPGPGNCVDFEQIKKNADSNSTADIGIAWRQYLIDNSAKPCVVVMARIISREYKADPALTNGKQLSTWLKTHAKFVKNDEADRAFRNTWYKLDGSARQWRTQKLRVGEYVWEDKDGKVIMLGACGNLNGDLLRTNDTTPKPPPTSTTVPPTTVVTTTPPTSTTVPPTSSTCAPPQTVAPNYSWDSATCKVVKVQQSQACVNADLTAQCPQPGAFQNPGTANGVNTTTGAVPNSSPTTSGGGGASDGTPGHTSNGQLVNNGLPLQPS